MTSGTFVPFPLSNMWVDRAKRQRKVLTNIPELAASIREVGLINPITIKRDGELVAGERRYNAVMTLGWTHIMVQFLDELPEDQVYLIELEENVKRDDLSWQDRADAVKRYHDLRRSIDPEWSLDRTADALSISKMTASDNIAVAEAAKVNPALAELPKMKTALNITRRQRERALADIGDFVLTGKSTINETAPILNGDFIEWQKQYSGPKFNFIHCDFPYGVNAHKSSQNTGTKVFGTYSDKRSDYWDLVKALQRGMENVVADQAHLIFWFSMDEYASTRVALTNAGWSVFPFPLIWYKSDNTGIIADAARRPRHIYETAFFASRGDRKIIQAVSDCFSCPGREKEIHMSEKPRDMLLYFLRMVVDQSSTVLDPTCGSGNALRVARHLGARAVFGLEKNEEFYKDAVFHFFDTI